jgi:hypothetical protein
MEGKLSHGGKIVTRRESCHMEVKLSHEGKILKLQWQCLSSSLHSRVPELYKTYMTDDCVLGLWGRVVW